MVTKIKTFVGSLASCVLFVSTAAAQTQTPSGLSALDQALRFSVCGRIQAPITFATRDTTFALSLPGDEPAEVYIHLTVGKNGKVKEKLTRVNANHIARYVAPAFLVATKDLRIDRNLLAGMNGKDTSLTLTFQLAYQCVYDTINKEWPNPNERIKDILDSHSYYYNSPIGPRTIKEINENMNYESRTSLSWAEYQYKKATPTHVWYYLAFIKDQQE